MSKINPVGLVDDKTEDKNFLMICCGRLCHSNFDDKSYRSKSAMASERDLSKLDENAHIRGRWDSRLEFLLSCVGFAVGLGNVWRFPIKVYESGGGAFLIPYLVLCMILGVPLLLMEMGIGQFSGRGPTKTFKCVPLFFAIGWGMVAISFCIDVYYGVIIAWAYLYLFGSFDPNLPWSKCTNSFNTLNCLDSYKDKSTLNASLTYVSSTQEYWDYYVTGFFKSPGVSYTMNEYPGPPQWHLALCLLLVWLVAAASLMFGVKVSGKVIYFTALFPYVALIFLIILGCTLPGALYGIKYYLTPDFGKMMLPSNLLGTVEQLFFSTSIAMGGMITFASFNNFHDNIYRDVVIVIWIDFFTSFIAGFAVFPILGYMAVRAGAPIEKVVSGGPGLFFVTYPEALATLPGANFWTLLFMLMTISLGMDSQFAMLECVSTSIMDTFPILRKTKSNKAICVSILCLVFYLCGLLIICPGGMYYFSVLDSRVSSYGLPFVACTESIILGAIYGIKNLRLNYRMMLGFSLNWYWLVMMGFVSPLIIFIILIASIVKYQPIRVDKDPIPIWGEVLAILLLCLVVLPVFIGMAWTFYNYRNKYPKLTGKELFIKMISPPVWWGPYYKTNWLLSSHYREKLLQVKDDPEFISHIEEVEDIDAVIRELESFKK